MQHDGLLWLVKSSGRVLGPFPTLKVGELLRTREISVLDEISTPLRRWQTIQYHEEFREVVDSLRKANLSERTEATWTPTTTQLTQTLTDLEGGDLTDELTNSLDGFTSTAKEIVVHHVQEQTNVVHINPAARYQPQAGQSTAIQRQVEKTTRGLWIFTAVVLCGAAAFILQKRFASGAGESKPFGGNIKTSVVAQVQVGHYADALRDLKNYYTDPMQAGELAIYYGSLLTQLEGQTLIGKRLFNLVLQSKRPEVKQAYTGLAVTDLIDGQYESARENLERALAVDGDFVPALINMGAVSLQKGDYAEAKRYAFKALRLNPAQGEALLMLAEAQLYAFKADGNAANLTQVAQLLREFRAKKWDFAGEIGFYQLYFQFLLKPNTVVDSLQTYLDVDPRLTADHRHNMFIYRGRTQWKVLSRFCEQMADGLGDDARVSTLLASCYAREARWDSARRSIEKAVQQSPKDPLIQAWLSFVLRESGDADKASVQLGSAIQANRRGEFVLPHLLQARFCQQAKIVECARDNWQKIYERNLDALPAVAGLAWVQAEIKSQSEALKLINRGLRLSPEYIPLLELRQRAETEGWYAGQ